MDIFNKKRVAELEEELKNAKSELEKSRQRATNYNTELTAFYNMAKIEEALPEGCIKGDWCKACEFGQEIRYFQYDVFGNVCVEANYACGKGKSCKNFIQKETENG